MKMIKRGFSVFLGLLLATGFFALGDAHAAGQNGQVLPVQPGQTMVKQNPQSHPFLGMLDNLNLTKTQKAEVASILKTNESHARLITRELANAGIQVRRDFAKGEFNSNHFDNWVRYERQGAQLRANVMAEILPKLTQQQKTTLLSMQNDMNAKIASAINSRFARLNQWISKNSG